MLLRRWILPCVVCFFSAAPAWGTEITTVLNPGFLKLEIEGDYRVLDLLGFTGGEEHTFGSTQFVYPLQLHYGLARGAEVAATIPLSSRIFTRSSQAVLTDRIWDGIGDLKGGVKLKLISDTEETPAMFVEALCKIPTGHSRFRDYVDFLYNPEFPISGTDTDTFELILKGIMSMYLDPAEIYLELTIKVPGADDFRSQGVHEHIDYGTVISLLGGVEFDLSDHWVFAGELLEISTAAATWRRNGVHALELAGEDSSAFLAQTRAQAGVNLGNLSELYLGPTLTWNPAERTRIKFFAMLGFTPDSETFRLGATISTTFSVGQIIEFRRGQAAPPAGAESPVVADLPKSVVLLEPAESGNQQRFIKQHTDRAMRARSEGRLGLACKEIKQILLQYPNTSAAQTEYKQLQAELDAIIHEQQVQAGQALKRDDLVAAVRAWRIILTQDPSHSGTLAMLRDYDANIRDQAKELYLQGMSAYVRGDYEGAIATWERAQILNPGDEKLKDSIAQTRRKIQTLKQIQP